MRLSRPRAPRRFSENTIPLINVVFLMLIFFLIAGTLAPPLDPEVSLIATNDAEGADPPAALSVTADGRFRAAGEDVTIETWLAGREAEGGEAAPVTLAVDRELPADRLIDILTRLRTGGAGPIEIVTERK
ncbi:biopolymer transporter ExbD [Chelativorans sp. M5D2P16]|uniref:ExbD/TolR family protein n=1 Tax=Chelativorans sp. M5D2P16 TaxID=3095678 RepID=UPI002ACAE675|nr:biopolymer transporter ExbD [Chelativorans sp. M5D2P16]MDZ5698224.1 biopolymer transporter ExbD [Chelativorans sp. M5D2P16]